MIFLHQQEIKEFQIYEIQQGSRAEAGQGLVGAAHRLLVHQCLASRQPSPPGCCSPQEHGHCSGCQWDWGGWNHSCAPGCSRRVQHPCTRGAVPISKVIPTEAAALSQATYLPPCLASASPCAWRAVPHHVPICMVVSEYKGKTGEELLQISVLADKADIGGLSLFCTSLNASIPCHWQFVLVLLNS